MSETTPTPWSPARAAEPDRRECSPGCAGCVPACGCQRAPTAPCLSCQAGLCAEHGPTVTATTTGASAPPLGYGTLTPTPRMLLHSIGCIRGHGCVPGCTGVGPIPLHPGQAGYEEELLAKAAAHAPAQPQPEPTGEHVATFTQGRDPFTGEPVYTLVSKDAPAPPAEAKSEAQAAVADSFGAAFGGRPPAEATGPHKAERLAATLRRNAMPTNYGDFLREVADYLETVPGMERQLASAKAMFSTQATEDAGMSLAECIAHERRMLEEKTAKHAAVIAPAPPQPEPVFCNECGVKHRHGENTPCPRTIREAHPAWKEAAKMNEWVKPHVAPAPPAEAKGEDVEEKSPEWWRGNYAGSCSTADVIGRALTDPLPLDGPYGERIEPVRQGIAALRTRAREAEEQTERTVREWDVLWTAACRERDEAREQREDLANEILAERSDLAAATARAEEAERKADEKYAREVAEWKSEVVARAERERDTERAARLKAEEDVAALKTGSNEVAKLMTALRARLAAAEAEVKRLRSAYDDPTTDATDGAHPAWWRGSDAGVAGAVRIVNEALDGPLPLPGCVGGADLEAVRQRVATLRASVQRLVEAGDRLMSGCGWERACAAWAAAKADAPAAGGGR